MDDDNRKPLRRPSNATLTTVAALITAIASLIAALNGCSPT